MGFGAVKDAVIANCANRARTAVCSPRTSASHPNVVDASCRQGHAARRSISGRITRARDRCPELSNTVVQDIQAGRVLRFPYGVKTDTVGGARLPGLGPASILMSSQRR